MLFVFTLAMAMALQGDAGFDEGVRLYKQTEYEEAIVRFEQVSTRASLSPADHAEALLWLGLAHAGSGDVDMARSKFREALTADSNVALPAQSSPSIVILFDGVRAELAAAAPAPVAPVAPVEPAAGPRSIVFIGGGVAAGGAILLVTGGVLAALAAGSLETAKDDEQFQSDAKAALDAANGQALGAGLLLPLGAALAVAGGALVALNLE